MPTVDPMHAILVPVALGAGLIRGFAGFGGPLVMLPVLNLYLIPAASIWVMMCVDLFVNIRLLPESFANAARPVLRPLVVGTLVTMPIGVWLMAGADPTIMKRVIGATIFLAALVLLAGWRYPRKPQGAEWVAAGMFSGLIFGATSIAVTVALFLSAGGQSAAGSRANFIVWSFITTVVLLALLVLHGAIPQRYALDIAILAPAYLLGATIGARLQSRAPEHIVRRIVLLLAATMGAAGALL